MVQKIPATVVAAAVLVVIATGIIFLTVLNSQETGKPVLSDIVVHVNPAGPVIPGVTTAATTSATIMTTTLATNRSQQNVVNEYAIVPVNNGFTYYDTTVFTAKSVGNYSYPVVKKDPGITIERAKDVAMKALPTYSPDRVVMEYIDGTENTRTWKFTLYRDDQEVVIGDLYPDTGDLMDYQVNPRVMAEQGTSNPQTTLQSAQMTAENEIRERNGGISLTLIDSGLKDGKYVFVYKRIIRDIPCARDGITINVDTQTGNIISYFKFWYTPENAVAVPSVPPVSRDAATALVTREARLCYPESADGFKIVSANIQWMDLYNPDEFIPEAGVIPCAWNIQFDDKTIRAWEFPVPSEGWVDAQNGTLLVFNYFHCTSNCG